jgi:general secretion pathway protein D
MGRLSDQVRCSTIIRSVCAVAFALCTVSLLTSCNVATTGATAPGDIDVLDKVRSLDIMPRQAQGVNSAQQNAGERSRAAVFEGTEITDVAEARPRSAASGDGSSSGGGGYDLNFENTPIATVAKVMIGDILNTGYIIDPRVQGTITLVSVRPVPKSDIVFVLENALRPSGVVLLRDSNGYRLPRVARRLGSGRWIPRRQARSRVTAFPWCRCNMFRLRRC